MDGRCLAADLLEGVLNLDQALDGFTRARIGLRWESGDRGPLLLRLDQ
jgi:hypothetical protein